MAKTDYKIQVSWKQPNGRIDVVRGDDKKELRASYKDLLDFLGELTLANVVEQQDEDWSQDPDDYAPSLCPIHTYTDEKGNVKQVQMELQRKPQPDGPDRTWYSHKTTDPRYDNNPAYDSWFCNGRLPKG